jgi:hypothetical protein
MIVHCFLTEYLDPGMSDLQERRLRMLSCFVLRMLSYACKKDDAYAFIAVCLRGGLVFHECCTLELLENVMGIADLVPECASAAFTK